MASGILEVLLVGAEGIKQRNKLGCLNCLVPCNGVTNNSCALIQFGDQKRISKAAKRVGRKQVWNEMFKFKVNYTNDEIQNQNHKLIFYIGDKHNISADEFAGESTIYVKDVLIQGMDKGKEELKHRKYRVVRPDKIYSGEIFVAVTFTKVDYEINKGKDETKKEGLDLEGK